MVVNVLLCRVDGNFGGVERHILSVAEKLDRSRFYPIVVTLANEGELARFAQAQDIDNDFISMPSRLSVYSAKNKLIEIARKWDAGIVHTFGIRSNTLAALAQNHLTIPWIIRLPNINQRDYKNQWLGWLAHRYNNALIRKADALQVISPQLESYVNSWPQPPKRVYRIPNGVDFSIYTPKGVGEQFRKECGIPLDSPLIGTVGRLDYVKGYDILLNAFRIVTRGYPNARLLIVGEGPERTRLEEQAKSLSIANAVLFAGYRTDISKVLEACTIYVCSSRSEGVPNAMLEAMAMELPIVSTRVGGIESILSDTVQGNLVPCNDEKALDYAIMDLLSNPENARKLGQEARRRVEIEFSLDTMVKRVETMYEELLG